MWSYFGAKTRIVHLYPKPQHNRIIEPFAGSARYALRHFDHDVLLIDRYEVIVRTWKYLQQCSTQDILSLPNVSKGDDISKLDIVQEAKYLMGFCINRGSVTPKNIVADFCSWNTDKKVIAKNLFKIRHWRIELGDYRDIQNEVATWFIDPPYQFGGEYYNHSNKEIDYVKLAAWCKKRKGQVMVCENSKADWLPFHPVSLHHGANGRRTLEVIWTNFDMPIQPQLF